jgi:trimeric autotransporter adhesin
MARTRSAPHARILLVVLIIAVAGAVGVPRASATSERFVVNSAANTKDRDGCQQPTSARPARDCTLREAIIAANHHHPAVRGELDVITFKPSLTRINVPTALPTVAERTKICGDCGAPSRHLILNGPGSESIFDGLLIAGARSIVRGLTIRNFGSDGVEVTANRVSFFDDRMLNNLESGLHISGGGHDQVGGSSPGQGNVISGNASGITIDGGAGGNSVRSNLIGTDVTGALARPNKGDGIGIRGVADNIIGGTATADRNVISANAINGIFLDGTAVRTVIEANFIGTDVNGTSGLGNGGSGVLIGTPGNTVGGTAHTAGVCDGTCNLISGNGTHGIFLSGDAASGNLLQGNFIGTNLGGNAPLPNAANGVQITFGSAGSIIGGTTAAARNVISGNVSDGILLFGTPGPNGILVEGNFIGTGAAGTGDVGNGSHGIQIIGSGGEVIGGDEAGAGNTIAFNGGDGVSLVDSPGPVGASSADAIRRNSIFSNAGLGIDLGDDGVTANDAEAQDAEAGPKGFQNHPQLTSATSSTRVIVGELRSTPNTTFDVQLYASPACDDTTFGEGKTFLGRKSVTTDGTGVADFTVTVSRAFSPGRAVTATAESPGQDTSEFSKCVTAV